MSRGIQQMLSKHKNIFFYLAIAIVLFMSYSINIFGVGLNKGWFDNFEQYSSSIVVKTVECDGLIDGYAGPLYFEYTTKYNPGCSRDDARPYKSQFGLQSRIFTAIASDSSDNIRFINVAKVSLIGIFIFLLIGLMHKIKREFGVVATIAVAALLAISPWIAGFSSNLYWVVFTIFLPFIFSFCWYERFKASRRILIFYTILGLLFLLKFLNGYEYASTLMMSAFIPVVYFELKNRHVRTWQLWRPALATLSAGVLAIALAISMNVAGLKEYAGGWQEASSMVAARAEDRSSLVSYKQYVINSLVHTAPPIYERLDTIYDLDQLRSGEGNIMKYIIISVLNYAMLPAVSLPFVLKEPVGTLVQSILFVGILAYVALLSLMKRAKRNQLKGLHYMYWLGLVSAVSWLVLMPGHAFAHPHINAVIFYLPYLIICYIIFGLWLNEILIKKNKKHAKRT